MSKENIETSQLKKEHIKNPKLYQQIHVKNQLEHQPESSSNLVKNLVKSDFFGRVLQIQKKFFNYKLVFSFILSFVLLLIFVNLINLRATSQFSDYQLGTFVTVILVYFSMLWFFSGSYFFPDWSKKHRWLFLLKSQVLSIFVILYYFDVHQQDLSLTQNLNINTLWVFIPLTVIMGLSYFYLFQGASKEPFFVSFIQVFLITIQSYSLSHFLELQTIQLNIFRQEWMENVISFQNLFWPSLGLIAISAISLIKLLQRPSKHKIFIIFTFSLLILELGLWINRLETFSYWYQSMLLMIVWDFLYKFFDSLVEGRKILTRQITISGLYHLILIFVVIIFHILT